MQATQIRAQPVRIRAGELGQVPDEKLPAKAVQQVERGWYYRRRMKGEVFSGVRRTRDAAVKAWHGVREEVSARQKALLPVAARRRPRHEATLQTPVPQPKAGIGPSTSSASKRKRRHEATSQTPVPQPKAGFGPPAPLASQRERRHAAPTRRDARLQQCRRALTVGDIPGRGFVPAEHTRVGRLRVSADGAWKPAVVFRNRQDKSKVVLWYGEQAYEGLDPRAFSFDGGTLRDADGSQVAVANYLSVKSRCTKCRQKYHLAGSCCSCDLSHVAPLQRK